MVGIDVDSFFFAAKRSSIFRLPLELGPMDIIDGSMAFVVRFVCRLLCGGFLKR